MHNAIRILLIPLCIAFSAMFSASEIAYLSLPEITLRRQAEENKKARRALWFYERFDKGLLVILVGNNLVNIGASSLAAAIAIAVMGEKGVWLSTLLMTVLILLFGEILPKIIASERPEETAGLTAVPLRGLYVLLYPVVSLLNRLLKAMSGLWARGETDDTLTEDDLETLLDTVEDEGVVDGDVTELLQSAMDFDDVLAYEIITPRVDMLAIDMEDDREEILKAAYASPYTRIPVYRHTPDHMVGILHLNRLFKALVKDPEAEILPLLLPVVNVHKTTPLPDVLDTMRRLKSHMVIVTDEYGGTMGLLTMEDVLEQLVGEIWDESDTIEEDFVSLGDNTYEVDGDMRLEDFLDEFDIEAEELDDDNATVGGWAVENLGGYPKLRESFTFRNLTVTVIKKDKIRVLRLLVEAEPEENDGDTDEKED